MKIISITCPNCNGKLDFDLDDTKIYCPYCGQKLMIDYEAMDKLYIEKENTKQEQEKTKRVQIETDYKKKRLLFAGILCCTAVVGFTAYYFTHQTASTTPTKQVTTTQESDTKTSENLQNTSQSNTEKETENKVAAVTPTPQTVKKETETENSTEIASEIPDDFSLTITSFNGSDFSTVYKDGTYKVGTDIPAGKYGAFNAGAGTGFANLYSDSTKSDYLDGGGWSNYFCFVNIEEGQLLEIQGLALVPYSDIEAKGPENYGIFTGGDTLPVGEYYLTRLDTSKDGLYSVYSDTSEANVLEYNYYPESAFLTVKKDQIVVLQNTKAIKAPSDPVNTKTVSKGPFNTVYPENMYRIGTDIDAGTYVAYGPQKWTSSVNIKKDSSATKDISYNSLNCCEILSLQNGIVDVTQDSYLVKYSDIESLSPDVTGIYIVGKDIDAGEYKITPDSSDNSHYWAIYNIINDTFTLNKENYIEGNDYITLSENEAFIIQNTAYEKQ